MISENSNSNDNSSFGFEVAGILIESVPRLMRMIRSEMRATAKPQLTISQMRIMVRLFRKIDTISNLAENQGVSAPAMSKMIGGLEKAGMAKRISVDRDRRHVGVKLTEEGKKILGSIRKIVREKLAEKLLEISESDKKTVLAGLEIMGRVFSDGGE